VKGREAMCPTSGDFIRGMGKNHIRSFRKNSLLNAQVNARHTHDMTNELQATVEDIDSP
jgi:hypothetical protein